VSAGSSLAKVATCQPGKVDVKQQLARRGGGYPHRTGEEEEATHTQDTDRESQS